MDVTFDTNVLVSATMWDLSVAQKLLHNMLQQMVKVNCSTPILSEISTVLARDFMLSQQEIDEVLNKILSFVTIVVPKRKIDVIKEDPDDNAILECAVESNSKYIITYDTDLLKLQEFEGIQIITPEIAKAMF